MNKHMKIFILIVVMLMLAGCAIKEVEPITPNEVSDEQAVSELEPTHNTPEETPTPQYEHTSLLTGLPIEEKNTVRPIAVLINNLKPARPQSGLQEADIIWEVLAEGGITRLVAIFQSTAADEVTIGPVRSNRPYFIEIADSYNAVIAHAGGSNDAYAILQNQKKAYLDEITNAGPAYWRSKERKAPHNLYTNLKKLREQIEKKSYTNEANMKGYLYEDVEPISTTSAAIDKLEVKFQLDGYKVGYEFDKESKQYIRLVNDEQHKDKDTETLLAAKNLVFLQTAHKVLDAEGRLEVDLKTGGHALVINNETATTAKWIKAEDGMITFLTSDGQEVKLLRGKTFIHVLPSGKDMLEQVKY